jgi:methionyl-tRNA formyltransferase
MVDGVLGRRALSIVLVAEESAGVHVLRALAQTEHRIHAVLTGGAGHGASPGVGAVAGSLGLPVWPAARIRDPILAHELAGAGIDLILNVHSLHLVPEPVLAVPAIGAFNLHPGPLPRYAGLNCPSWAIYHGERSYGVTVHWMAPRIDAGPIAYAATFDIEETDTAFRLSAKCIRAGIPLMLRLVDTAATAPRAIPALAQDLAGRRYFGRQAPRNAAIDWAEPAARIAALVRACNYAPFVSPWGQAHARCDGHRLEILDATCTGEPCDAPPGLTRLRTPPAIDVATADEWLRVRSARVDGRPMAPAALADCRLDDGDAGDQPAPSGARLGVS